MNTSHEYIYYLDPWFIAREYEARRHTSLPTKVQRGSDSKLQASIGLFKTVSGSHETLEFNQTPEALFWEISAELNDFPEYEFGTPNLPSVFWASGTLTMLQETHSRTATGFPDEIIDDVWSFSLQSSGLSGRHVRLLSDDGQFRYNIQKLLNHPTTLGDCFRPKVRALLKSLTHRSNSSTLLATPLVIIEVAEP